ncbi:hypothetical protein E2C01_008931 [Portunus trituberculatus]|uniref:Uncharacterized protein n=1 Tax=Portunus trituberculatus TaxID=210409 RepID=A0A5B7D513_PORTR|nr:hypothetical protein [Portunus trituberculatus]
MTCFSHERRDSSSRKLGHGGDELSAINFGIQGRNSQQAHGPDSHRGRECCPPQVSVRRKV